MKKSIFQKIASKWRRFKARHRASYYSEFEARSIAEKYDLIPEYEDALDFGLTPDEALEEWDIYPYGQNKEDVLKNIAV